MNIRKKKQKHVGAIKKPTLRQTIRRLLKMFANRKEKNK